MKTKSFSNVTRRWCLTCKDIKNFEFVKRLGHSRCSGCGGGFGVKMDLIQEILMEKYKK